MSSAKKIGLFACTGVVAGNMMGSGGDAANLLI